MDSRNVFKSLKVFFNELNLNKTLGSQPAATGRAVCWVLLPILSPSAVTESQVLIINTRNLSGRKMTFSNN